MNRHLLKFGFAALLGASTISFAQAPAGKPADATGQCKDGSYTTNPNKKGACAGHQGVKTWFQTVGGPTDPDIKSTNGAESKKSARQTSGSVANPSASDATVSNGRAHAINQKSGDAVVATPANNGKTMPGPAANGSASSSRSMASKSAAPGGGPGLVWVNTESKVYHCYGTATYGKTKSGKYVSEQQAMQMGAKADHGKACSAK